MSHLDALRSKLQTAAAKIDPLAAKINDGTATEAEISAFDALADEADQLRAEIATAETEHRRARAETLVNSTGPKTRSPTVPAQPRAQPKVEGTFGQFALGVAHSKTNQNSQLYTQAVMNATSTFGSGGIGADGGFAVPPEFSREILRKVTGEESLVSRARQMVISGNSIDMPTDEGAPWDNTTGVRVFWSGEGTVITPSKPALSMISLKLQDLTGLVPITNQLLEDAPALDGYIRLLAPEKMAAAMSTAMIRGTGVGMPLGLLNSTGLVVVPAEPGQAADTITYANITRMWSRLYGPCRSNAVWLINQEAEQQLLNLQFVPGAPSPVPAYLPANGLAGTPFATLLGRPVIPVQACSALGDVGDIMLVDWQKYLMVTKADGIQAASSIHMYFDQNLTAYRFVLRADGRPQWNAPVAPQFGTSTLSAFVALAAR